MSHSRIGLGDFVGRFSSRRMDQEASVMSRATHSRLSLFPSPLNISCLCRCLQNGEIRMPCPLSERALVTTRARNRALKLFKFDRHKADLSSCRDC